MPDTLQFANNAVAVVDTDLSNTDTVVNLPSGTGALFPATEGFRVTLEDRRVWPVQREICHCVLRMGDQLTLRRAMEGTNASSFKAGFTVSNRVTAAALNAIVMAGQQLTQYWLGVWPTPPTTGLDGGPIPEGAMYFNTTTGLTYTWDGAAWRSLMVPQQALQIRLYYNATAGQTDFGNAPDLQGQTLTLNDADKAPVYVYRNGELLWADNDVFTGGDYTINWVTNRIILKVPATAGQEYELDQMVPTGRLPPAATDARGLRDINLDPVSGSPGYIDGTRTVFPLRDLTNTPVVMTDPYMAGIFLDGVHQRPAADYSVAGGNITFVEAPPAGTTFWGFYYGVRGGTILTVPLPTVVGQVLVADATLHPAWSTVIDEGTF